MRYLITIFLGVLLSLLMNTPVFADDKKLSNVSVGNQINLTNDTPEEINIIVVLSYDALLPWSREMIAGIADAAQQYPSILNVYTESMFQTKTTPDASHIVNGLAIKYADKHIDAIISDSILSHSFFNALAKSSKFKDTYKLAYNTKETEFSNVNNIDIISYYTYHALRQNYQSMLNLQPDLQHIFINDSETQFFSNHLQALHEVIKENQRNIQITIIPFDTIPILKRTLSELPNNSAFVYMPILKNNIGKNLSPKGILNEIKGASNAPIFSSWITFMGSGVVGGYIFDPREQGNTMLNVVMAKLLNNDIPTSMPVANWMFDETELLRFNLPIPEQFHNSIIFNQHSNIFEDYPAITLGLVALILSLTFAVFWFKYVKLNHTLRELDHANEISIEKAALASRSSNAKSKFLANISHEIRTPINGMFGVLNILGKTPLNDEQIKLMQMGRYCTENLLRTVNDVLDFSKLESSQLQLKTLGFSPVQTLKESYAYAQLISESKPITVELDITKLIDVPLLGDHTRIRQILDNLINNAVKFTHSGNITISAYITPVDGLYQLHCLIKDTGEGITSDDAKKLFQPFVQIEDSYSKERSGTGLGLALCKELVELMGGEIKLTSEKEQGTEVHFHVTLPLADSIEQVIESSLPFDVSLVQGTKVLLVEDNPINQEITQVQLAQFGIECDIAENGQECLEFLQSTQAQYSVILMDIQMPIMDGYSAARSIRDGVAGSAFTSIPIIALTAHVSLEEQQKALLAGMNKHINKPIDPEQLTFAIYDCIHQSAQPMQ